MNQSVCLLISNVSAIITTILMRFSIYVRGRQTQQEDKAKIHTAIESHTDMTPLDLYSLAEVYTISFHFSLSSYSRPYLSPR